MGRGVVVDTRVKIIEEVKPDIVEEIPVKKKQTKTVKDLPTLSNSKITKNNSNYITIIPMG